MPSRRSKISLAVVVLGIGSRERGEQRDRISGRAVQHNHARKIGDIDGVFTSRQHSAASREFKWNGGSGDRRSARWPRAANTPRAPAKRLFSEIEYSYCRLLLSR